MVARAGRRPPPEARAGTLVLPPVAPHRTLQARNVNFEGSRMREIRTYGLRWRPLVRASLNGATGVDPTAGGSGPVRSVEMRSREPVLVIELQGASLRAPAAALVGERAAAIVALEDLALDRSGNVTRTQVVGLLVRCLPCLPTRGEALLLDLLDQQVESLFEDGRHISVRDSVPEQILGLAELVTTRATRGELKLERLLGERGNHGPAFIASRCQRGWRCERERERRLGQRTRHRSAERECG